MVPLRGGRDRGDPVSAAASASPLASTTTSFAGRRGDLVAAAASVPKLSRASAPAPRPGAAVPSGRSPRADRGPARPRANNRTPRTRAPVGASAATTPRPTKPRGRWPRRPSPLQRLNQPAVGAAATSTPGPVPPLRVAPRPCRRRWRRAGAAGPKEPAMGAAGATQRPCRRRWRGATRLNQPAVGAARARRPCHQGWGKRTPPRRTPRTPRRSRCPRCRCAPRR